MEMKDWDECWLEEEAHRKLINPSNICGFGIKPLDDALIGMLKNDFIVIGADSGAGKSEICLDMAMHNARNGKTVALYFIEGGAEEAITRLKWKAIKKRYYQTGQNNVDMDYRSWVMNMTQSQQLEKIEAECFSELRKQIGNRLKIYSFEEGFTITHLINSLGYFSKGTAKNGLLMNEIDIDLIIIDHLQYFTLENPSNELSEMTQILTKVKNITNFHKVPVVLVSHLRKKDKERGLPSQEDFYGTSNIAKIASLAITITPHSLNDNYSAELYPTFFRFVKSRTGIRQSYAALCNFNYKLGKYEESYSLYKLRSDKPEPEPMTKENLPKWAKQAVAINKPKERHVYESIAGWE